MQKLFVALLLKLQVKSGLQTCGYVDVATVDAEIKLKFINSTIC